MEFTANATDVLVVGAGPTGLIMALELARRGIACRIIDKLPEATQTSKALAIQSRTLELFDIMGMVEEPLQHGLQVGAVNLYANGKRIAHMPFDELDSPYPFILDLAQSETEKIFTTRLAKLGVAIERQVELSHITQDEQGITAILRHADGREETVTCIWLIGCDGAHSTVRHLLNMPFVGAAYPEDFALADVKIHWSLPTNEMHLMLHEDGIFAAFPLPGGRYRLIVETSEHAHEDKQPDPTLEDFQRYLKERGPEGATLDDPVWMSAFRIHARKVEHYRQGHVFLVGDAAHIHSPAGGQGMNTGIQDVCNLAWKLALVHTQHTPLTLLDSYEAERHPVAESVLQTSDLMIRMAMLHQPLLQQVRNHVVPILSQIEPVQHRFVEQISELNIHYRNSPIVCEQGSFPGHLLTHKSPKAGDRAPAVQPLFREDGTATRLFEVLRSTKHTLFLLTGEIYSATSLQRLNKLANLVNEHYDELVQVYFVVAGEQVPAEMLAGIPVLLDKEKAMQLRYSAGAESLYLIRPDGYIGYRGLPKDANHFWNYLHTILL
jgi:2-polyprenyl-6-methoxyphenol hydroxylase-like FAD-dependent oxidoreductase